MLFVDTNVFLEMLLNQENSTTAREFFDWAYDTNIKLVCSHFSIHSIAVVLSNLNKIDGLKKFLENLEYTKNLYVYATTIEEEKTIAEMTKKLKLDFDDSLQYFVAKACGCEVIVSFDKHLDRTDLKRKTPSDFLKEL